VIPISPWDPRIWYRITSSIYGIIRHFCTAVSGWNPIWFSGGGWPFCSITAVYAVWPEDDRIISDEIDLNFRQIQHNNYLHYHHNDF
jgi:hypothetical protein